MGTGSFSWGRGPPLSYLPLKPPLPSPFTAQAVIVTKDALARERVRVRLLSLLDEKFPDVVARVAPLELAPPVGGPLKYRATAEAWRRARPPPLQPAPPITAPPTTNHINSPP